MKITFKAYDTKFNQEIASEHIQAIEYVDGNIHAIQFEDRWWLVEDEIDLFVIIDGVEHPVTNQSR